MPMYQDPPFASWVMDRLQGLGMRPSSGMPSPPVPVPPTYGGVVGGQYVPPYSEPIQPTQVAPPRPPTAPGPSFGLGYPRGERYGPPGGYPGQFLPEGYGPPPRDVPEPRWSWEDVGLGHWFAPNPFGAPGPQLGYPGYPPSGNALAGQEQSSQNFGGAPGTQQFGLGLPGGMYRSPQGQQAPGGQYPSTPAPMTGNSNVQQRGGRPIWNQIAGRRLR